MKKVLLLIFAITALVLASGCSTVTPKYIERVYSLDYSEYSESGFFITESNSVNFEYTPIATVVVTIYEGEGGEWKYYKGKMYHSGGVAAMPADALEKAVSHTKQLGGNALINLKLTPSTINIVGIEQSGIILSGMAIKR